LFLGQHLNTLKSHFRLTNISASIEYQSKPSKSGVSNCRSCLIVEGISSESLFDRRGHLIGEGGYLIVEELKKHMGLKFTIFGNTCGHVVTFWAHFTWILSCHSSIYFINLYRVFTISNLDCKIHQRDTNLWFASQRFYWSDKAFRKKTNTIIFQSLL